MPVINISFDKETYRKLQEIKEFYNIKRTFIDDLSDTDTVRLLVRMWKPIDAVNRSRGGQK
jgi:hypothetical protein